MGNLQQSQELIALLIARLERLSADSYWAHQASGVRGSLLRWVEGGDVNPRLLEGLIERGFEVLEKAAKEK
jgi:hypothetical protein